jgi:hypothetical protein
MLRSARSVFRAAMVKGRLPEALTCCHASTIAGATAARPPSELVRTAGSSLGRKSKPRMKNAISLTLDELEEQLSAGLEALSKAREETLSQAAAGLHTALDGLSGDLLVDAFIAACRETPDLHQTVTELQLQHRGLEAKSFERLCEYLSEHFRNLQDVDFSGNNLHDLWSADAMCNVILANEQLQSISLHGCELPRSAARQILAACQLLPKLKGLDLYGSSLVVTDIACLRGYLPTSLHYLGFKWKVETDQVDDYEYWEQALDTAGDILSRWNLRYVVTGPYARRPPHKDLKFLADLLGPLGWDINLVEMSLDSRPLPTFRPWYLQLHRRRRIKRASSSPPFEADFLEKVKQQISNLRPTGEELRREVQRRADERFQESLTELEGDAFVDAFVTAFRDTDARGGGVSFGLQVFPGTGPGGEPRSFTAPQLERMLPFLGPRYLPQLQLLDLEDTDLSELRPEAIELLAEALTGRSVPIEVDLAYTGISRACREAVLKALSSPRCKHSLDLRGAKFERGELAGIKGASLVDLQISVASMDDRSAAFLAHIFSSQWDLEWLDIFPKKAFSNPATRERLEGVLKRNFAADRWDVSELSPDNGYVTLTRLLHDEYRRSYGSKDDSEEDAGGSKN